MADETYNALVYHQQGSTNFVVASSGMITIESGGFVDIESGGQIDIASGGEISIESGGTIDVESGGTIDIESGGGISVESGGDVTVDLGGAIVYPVNGATSSGFNGSSSLSTQSAADGVTWITSSGGDYKITLAPPYLGAQKTIYNTAGTTGMVQYVSVGSGVGIVTTGGDSTAHMMVNEGTTVGAQAGWCHLTGLSTSRWIRTSYSPSSQWVIVSTSS